MRSFRIFGLLAGAAAFGLAAIGWLAWRAVSIEQAPVLEAIRQFDSERLRFAHDQPMLEVESDGRVVRRTAQAPSERTRLGRIGVLAYQAHEERLIRADVPFWFFKLKGPAANLSLRGTGLDLDKLGVTPGDLERHGPGLILDETRGNGDRLLVWTE